jgi:mannose-6-phosphate isomerase
MSVAVTHAPARVQPSFREKVWGSTRLSPWFEDSDKKIGEVWFEVDPPDFPILTKFVFTTEPLSVQVHPGDEYAGRHENSCGKTEMWYVLRADPGAQIALGLRQDVTSEQLRRVSESGEIMDLLNWIDVRPGDSFFIPAGTIHTIGAGIALAEIQQYSDVTYRLYDYGRPRELHLERGVEVSETKRFSPVRQPNGFIAHCEYFITEELSLESPTAYELEAGREHLLVMIEGSGSLNAHPARAGEVWLVPAGAEPFPIEPVQRLRVLRTYIP